MNGFAIGDVPNSTDFVDNIWIESSVRGARIKTALEAENNTYYAGGGKAVTVQFRARHVYCNVMCEDNDISVSVEAAFSDTRHLENVVLDVQSKDAHRTHLYVGGTKASSYTSEESAGYLHSLYPGVKIRMRAQGGQDAPMIHPVSGATEPNYANAGVVTLHWASGIDLELYAAIEKRCTLIRGNAAASTIRVSNALMDELEDVWDTRPLDTLPVSPQIMPDNVLEGYVHAKTHHGVVVRPHRDGATRTMVKSIVDLALWCQNGVGPITQTDGTTDEFGASVRYRFRDMKSSPIREVAGISGIQSRPAWSQAATAGKAWLGNFAANAFIPASESHVAEDSVSLILTALAPQVQEITGTEQQTVRLPSTGVVKGQSFTFINKNTALSVIVQSSNSNVIALVYPSRAGTYTALTDTPVTSSDWQFTPMNAATASTSNTLALRDPSGNVALNAVIANATSTPTAGGTTTLTVASSQTRVFTGSQNQTVVLPTTSIVAGQQYVIINNSTGTVTVNASGGGLVKSLAAGESALLYALAATPTTAAHWRVI